MIPGSTFKDLLPLFEADEQTRLIVLIGEIGGSVEEEAAEYIRRHVTKPVIAMIAGRDAPRGRNMGHAGAIVSADGTGSAQSKEAALKDAGVHIAENTAHILALAQAILGPGQEEGA
jgi:succinyl-CoA synthetase alpha subunit